MDRSFTITGAGTVVTGTLAAGAIAVGDTVRLAGAQRRREVQVRGLQSYGQAQQVVGPTARVAVNLRGVPADQVRRGDVLLAGSGADWPATASIDVRRVTGAGFGAVPQRVTAHVGTAAITARLRPFDDEHARLTLDHAVPLGVGDRIVLRGPGSRRVLGGVLVLDVDPPPLQRRGDGARRAGALAVMSPAADLVSELSRRGAVTDRRLRELGVLAGPAGGEGDPVPAGVRRWGGWWVHEDAVAVWTRRLAEAVAEAHDRDPLTGLPRSAAAALLGLPDGALVDEVARAAGVDQDGGRLRPAGTRGDLGPAEAAVAALERRLADAPFRAPEADDLNALELGPRELAAAERAGRILRLADGVVLLPGAPDLAVRRLAGLPQPFTTSQARQVLESTRRVVIPLLEHLDAAGATRRIDAGHRQLVNRDTGGG